MLLLCGVFIYFDAAAKSLRMHFIDVGEGEAILIQTPDDKNVLVDAGNFISAVKVEDYLKKQEVDALEYMIFTHPHLDHIAGGFNIVQRFAVKNICDNGHDLSQFVRRSDVYRWYVELIRENNRYFPLQRGAQWNIGNVQFTVLWPQEEHPGGDFNANSLVIMVEYNSFSCLLAGDATVGVEKQLLEMHDSIKADVLKVGHHGHHDASLEEFLKAVSPKAAVISVNRDNFRDYPSDKILDRLKDFNVAIYRTDQHGDIVFSIDKKGRFSVKTDKARSLNH